MDQTACILCNVKSIESDHNVSPKHIKNVIFYEYSQKKKSFTGNRKGIKVWCDVKSTTETIQNNVNPKLIISTKPNEVVQFNFKVLNETNAENILVVGVDLATARINFVMNNHPFVLGEEAYNLSPKQLIPKDIYVNFSSPNVGKYNMPIFFYFQKKINDEALIIVRDMVVFVEENPVAHEKIVSPFSNKDVRGEQFKPATVSLNRGAFSIPKNFKVVFRTALKIPEQASVKDQALYNTVIKSFEYGATEDNYTTYFHNLLWYEEFVQKSLLRRYNMGSCHLEVVAHELYELVVPGLAEKRPSLLKGDIVKLKPLIMNYDVIFEGIIVKIEADVAQIGKLCYEFHEIYNSNLLFDVAFVMSRVPLERMHVALNNLAATEQMCRVFPTANPNLRPVPAIQMWMNPLIGANPEQRAAVEHIVRGSAGLAPYILHGPPGTGKTVTIVEAILQILMLNKRNRVLVCTESNMGADHVACTLIQYSRKFGEDFLIRANSKFRDTKSLPEELKPFSEYCPESKGSVGSKRIVVTTLSHAAVYLRTGNPISHLFIDEAAQASEPACLVPIVALLDRAGSMVLAGDHMQLGPVIISHDAAAKGLHLSLMERLKTTCPLYESEDQNYTVMLRNNFRSHPDILEIPNRLFYENQLVPKAEEDPLSSTDIFGLEKHSSAIVFHGCSSKEQKNGKSPSFFNDMELFFVRKYITTLISSHGVRPNDIGVVTPYYKQAHRIKEWLLEKNINAIEVGTVESFQGKEKRVIIISTVRANCGLLDHDAKFKLGFLVDDKRFNVALTRAKAKVIIIGNPLCLQMDEKWKLYMKRCREHRTYCGFDSVIERNTIIIDDLIKTSKRLNNMAITDE